MGLIDHMPTEEELISLGCDSYREYIEPLDERKARIKLALISTPDLSQVEINPEDFSDKEIGDIIVARCFGGNPHAESALQAKTNAYLLSVMEGNPNAQIFEEITTKRSQVNEIRNKFNLNPL